MTQDTPVPTAPTYCQASDVAAILRVRTPSEHEDEGVPTLTAYKDAILSAEEHIDRLAKTSWRSRRVTEEYPFDGLSMMPDPEGFILVPLRRRNITALTTAGSDKLEVWNGSQFEDWLVTRTQGRNSDWYLIPESGELFLRTRVIYGNPRSRVRVTYRYGLGTVPHNVKRATALLAAADIANGSVMSTSGHGEVDYVQADPRINRWRDHANTLLTPHVAAEGL